ARLRRGAADFPRAPADGLFRGAADLRRPLEPRPQPAALRGAAAAVVAAGARGRRPVTRYLARRLVFAAALVVVVSSSAFLLARIAPGDFFSTPDAHPASV